MREEQSLIKDITLNDNDMRYLIIKGIYTDGILDRKSEKYLTVFFNLQEAIGYCEKEVEKHKEESGYTPHHNDAKFIYRAMKTLRGGKKRTILYMVVITGDFITWPPDFHVMPNEIEVW